MLERPNLADSQIITGLQTAFGFTVTELTFLPIGNDPTAWVYKVSTETELYFLKVKQGHLDLGSVYVPHALYQSGITQIVTPILNRAGELWTGIPLANYKLILYPYIDGRSGMEVGLSDAQWTELGAILRRMHSTNLHAQIDLFVGRESFIPNPRWTSAIQAIEPKLSQTTFHDAYKTELAAFWNEHTEEIKRIINRTHELGQLVKARSLPFVICHADIHTANVLVDSQGKLYIADWDGSIFAPKERDLMFIIGEKDKTSLHEQAFLEGYGAVEIDWQAMAYYRYEWVVQEIAEYGELIFLTSDRGEVTRADAVRGFKQLFTKGDVVEQAYKSEKWLT